MSTPKQPDAANGFPVILDLAGQAVLVVGAGDAAAATCRGLRAAGAVVRVVDPAPGTAMQALAGAGEVTLRRGTFAPADLEGVRLCYVTGPDAAGVVAQAHRHGVLVNAIPRSTAGPDGRAVPAPGRGRATLVGAGPGDAGHLTLAALNAIRQADVILYDKLVGPAVLELARPEARRIDVGKRCGRHAMSQDAINRLMVRHAGAGAHVVRLKGGDPFVFGRGGEEMEALRAAGFAVEVVPGITACLAVAARLGIPLTHRGTSRSLHLITAHAREDSGEAALPGHDWAALAALGGTLAVYMGARTLPGLSAALLAAGMPPATPAVAVENATLPQERHVSATLATIAGKVAEAGCDGPTLVLIGEMVALAEVAADGLPHRSAA